MMIKQLGMLILVGLLTMSVGCQSRLANKEKSLRGFFDSKSYTAPTGTFSIDMQEFVDLTTVVDAVEDEGASLRLRFSDAQGTRFTILVTYTLNAAPENFIDLLVEKRKAVDSNVTKTKTPEQIDCLLSNGFRRYKKSDKVQGEINLVFYKERTVFNLLISTPPFLRAQEAAKMAEASLQALWEHTRFRGRLDQQPISLEKDPRIPMVVQSALRAAAQLKYAVDVQRTSKPIIRMKLAGKSNDILLSLGINQRGKHLYTTEAISCVSEEEKLGQNIMEVYYSHFLQEMKKEKLHVQRELSYDADLLVSPK
jgi:hypothetical protein